MHQALYPHPVDDKCPYCGSENVVTNMDDFYPAAHDCKLQVDCLDCDKSHHLKYQLAGIALEDDNDPPNLVNFYVGYEIPDMAKEGEPDQGKTLVAAVQMDDGLFIMAHGYSDGASTYGYGAPVVIEMQQGRLRVLCWASITDDDVSDIVDLEMAKDEHDERSRRYGLRIMTPSGKPIEEHLFGSVEDAMAYDMSVVPSRHYKIVVDKQDGNKIVWDSRQS